MNATRGVVYLVGAGPGDPDLITVAGLRALKSADVVVYDRLVSRELLRRAPRRAECIDAGKAPGRHARTQEQINAVLVERARAGACVVRLKGGDPFVFGRGGEELQACREAGVACAVIPGVTSAVAAPAAMEIPVTQRGVARSFAVVTAQGGDGESELDLDYAALAAIDTVVVLMGRARLRGWVDGLVSAGMDPSTPAACIASATTLDQQTVRAPLADLPEAVERAELSAPMTAIVGPTAANADLIAVRRALPLTGRRIVLTGTRGHARRMRPALQSAGAIVLHQPFIAVRPVRPTSPTLAMIAGAARYDWVVFPSIPAVRGFFRLLAAAGGDARSLGKAKLAAVGPGTAQALRRHGLSADLVPPDATAEALAAAFQSPGPPGQRVLCPRGDRARPTLPQRLRDHGHQVDTVLVYRTAPTAPVGDHARATLSGADAIVFSSPSAVASFAEHVGVIEEGVRVAIGPVTAEALAAAGMPADVAAAAPTGPGLVAALERHFIEIAGTIS